MISISQFLGALLVSNAVSVVTAQGPNTLAVYNPNLRTQAVNGTWVLLPINSTIVQASVPYPLLPVPTSDATLFPSGFPAGYHPVLAESFYGSDIRMSALQIDALFGGAVYVPFVDRLSDGETPFQYPNLAIVGGIKGNSIAGLVPALVGSITGAQALLNGAFSPEDAAYSAISSTPLIYSAQGKILVAPNPVSGPGVIESIYDLEFSPTSDPLYTTHTFHSILNQPIIQASGLCSRNAVYFNESFANQELRTGQATLYSPPLADGFEGVYTGLGGFSGQGENVGYNPQDCADAAADVDPFAVQ